jgi:hypothetical protein
LIFSHGLFCGLVMSQSGVGCKNCKRVRAHVASLLPFKVIGSSAGKPLRVDGFLGGFGWLAEQQALVA